MQVGKQKPVFRMKLTDVKTTKSKTITIYEGKEKKSLEQVISYLIECLRKKE